MSKWKKINKNPRLEDETFEQAYDRILNNINKRSRNINIAYQPRFEYVPGQIEHRLMATYPASGYRNTTISIESIMESLNE